MKPALGLPYERLKPEIEDILHTEFVFLYQQWTMYFYHVRIDVVERKDQLNEAVATRRIWEELQWNDEFPSKGRKDTMLSR
jgi:hypothetical protein